MKKIQVRKSRLCLLICFLSSAILLDTSSLFSNVQAQEAVHLTDWTTSTSGDTTTLTNYVGSAKDVVIPVSGDLETTHVKITKKALRAAATSADKQGGTLVNSSNDPNGTGLVAENATDDNPFDKTVDYSGTFKDLHKITKIDLSKLKIKANNGADGQDVTGVNGQDATGGNGDRRIGIGGDSPNISGTSTNGILDPNLKPENLTGEKLRLYRLYTENISIKGMYCPIAVKEITQTLKTNQIVSDTWFQNNIGALRNPDTGDDLLDSEKGTVQITAINAHGTKVALADITKTPGTYTVSYAYRNETIQTTVTVKDANIVTKDLTIGTGDTWKAQDNFVCAVDAGDHPIGFDQLTVTGADQVNVNQPGSYSVTYAYQTASQTAKVTVIDIQTQKLASLDLDAPFDVYAGLKSVTNVDQIPHTDLAYFQAQVSVKGVLKGTTTPIDLTSFTRMAGTYTIIYTYAGISRSIDVVVEKKTLTDSSVFPALLDFESLPIQYQKDNILVGKENAQPASGSLQLTDTRSEAGEGYKIKVTQNQPFIGQNTSLPLPWLL